MISVDYRDLGRAEPKLLFGVEPADPLPSSESSLRELLDGGILPPTPSKPTRSIEGVRIAVYHGPFHTFQEFECSLPEEL